MTGPDLTASERKQLAAIERSLAMTDPFLDVTLSAHPYRKFWNRRRASLSVLGILAGIALLLLGVSTATTVFGLLGYGFLLVSAIGLWYSVERPGQSAYLDVTNGPS